MNFKKFLTVIQGVQMPVIPTNTADSPFGAAHAKATQADASVRTATKFEISDALAGHTFRRRHLVPSINR